jgi:cell division protein FtsI/penicillin-binding protein 2
MKKIEKSLDGSGRHYLMVAAVLLLFCTLGWRLLDLSFIHRSNYSKFVERARTAVTKIRAKRGNIFDRNMQVLAFDETNIAIGVDPYAANVDRDLKKIHAMAEFLEIDPGIVLEKFTKRRKISKGKALKVRWVPICEVSSGATYAAVKTIGVRGVYGIEGSRRSHPFGYETAHLLGFVSRDGIPSAGVEKYMNFYLRGQDGCVESERDGRARELVHYRKKDYHAEMAVMLFSASIVIFKKLSAMKLVPLWKILIQNLFQQSFPMWQREKFSP